MESRGGKTVVRPWSIVPKVFAAVWVAAIAAGCADAPPLPENGGVQHLAGRIRDASGETAPVTRETPNGSGREVVVVRATGTLAVSCAIPVDGALRFSIAGYGPPSQVGIVVRSRWRERLLWEAEPPVGGAWMDVVVDLAEYGKRTVDLELRVKGEAGGSVSWGSPVVTGPRGTAKNVLLYEIDTLRSDLLEPYGYPGRSSPVIGRLAREGVLFSDCLSTATWTRPAASSILSSLSPATHGVIWDNSMLAVDVRTLTDVLRDRGWYTVAFLANPNAGRPAGLDQGFDVMFEMKALALHAMRSDHADPSIRTTGTSGTSALIELMLADLLPQWKDLPLFLYIHPMDPHEPNEPRAPFSEIPDFEPKGRQRKLADEFTRYGQDVRVADFQLGRILHHLEDAGIRDNTLVAFTADHGQAFREHGSKSHGRDLFPETVNVPMILSFAGGLPRGVTVRQRTSVLDIVPTVLDLLDTPAPHDMEGGSRVGLARAATPGERFPDEPLFAQTMTLNYRRMLKAKDLKDPGVIGHVAVVRGHWKCIVVDYGDFKAPFLLLFDLRDDPGELHDVSAEHPELADSLRAEALAWWEQYRGDGVLDESVDPELQEQLRALGYVE